MNVTSWIRIVLTASMALPAAACLPTMDLPAASGGAAAGVDEQRILASVANGSYRHDPQFMAVSQKAYPSAIAAQNTINVWVTAADWAAYTRIAPEKSGSGASLSPGAIVVREVLDASGAVAKVTLMAKGPAGYNPMVGDFWFGVTMPDGTPVVDNGVTEMGKVQACFGCHMPRASDGYLFGVPMSDRASGGVPVGGASDGGVDAPGDGGSDMCTGGRHGKGGCGDSQQ